MRGIVSRRLHWTATLAVAFALLFQSLTIALAFSDGASQVRLDTFGNPICNDALNAANQGKGSQQHEKLPACCLFGCSLFVPFLAGPAGVALEPACSSSLDPIRFPALSRIDVAGSAYDPGNPRAPPFLI
jgi:hypothetical protein